MLLILITFNNFLCKTKHRFFILKIKISYSVFLLKIALKYWIQTISKHNII